MGAVYFYHLTETPLEATLPALLGKARGAGWPVELRGTDAQAMARLDEALWRGPDDGFEPHGLAGGPHDDQQPVLLTVAPGAGAHGPARACLMAVHGAQVSPGEVAASERVCILFDGHDAAALERARDQWRVLTAAGCAAQYWAQEAGGWVKRQDRAAAPKEAE